MMANNVCSILGFGDNFEQLKTRIDGLEQFVGAVSANLLEVERNVDIAEEELHVTDYSLKGLLLKPLKAKLSAIDNSFNFLIYPIHPPGIAKTQSSILYR